MDHEIVHSKATDRESGAALLSAMFVMLLMAGITAGFTALALTDTRVRSMDNTRTQSFYAVHAGLEQLTSDLGNLFAANVAPTSAQINALTAAPPALGVTWLQPDNTSGYRINYPVDAAGNAAATVMTVQNGPFQGLVGLATPYTMTVTGRLQDRSEASLTRTLQTVAIPVFQFGIFSENDLSFFAGPDFNFGGRVHTNQNLFLAEGNGNTLSLADRVTAVGEVVRTNLSNGWDTNTNYTGTVRAIRAPALFRDLARTEGSLIGTLGSGLNDPTWSDLSQNTYNHNVMNGRTGARRLDLPITQFGATPIDLIKRAVANENVTAPNVLAERFYTLASMRILLSDNAADITGLPGISAGAPVALSGAMPAALATSQVPPRAPFAATPNVATAGVLVPLQTPLLGGFLKIDIQTAPNVWQDVTTEVLQLGFGAPAYLNSNTFDNGGALCADIMPDAILRMQRALDNAGACFTLANLTTGANAPWRWVPQVLFDPREGTLRDTAQATMQLSGVMHFIELDVRNLTRWFQGAIGVSGPNALNVNGRTVYFSDRRGNRNAAGAETGEFGFEDIVNPLSAAGTPNNVLNTGEDFNGSNALDMYGNTARLPPGVADWTVVGAPLATAGVPANLLTQIGAANTVTIARRNPLIFFRRALKLTNGVLGNIIAPGLTVTSENPVYIQGNWNANNAGFGNPHVATAVIADSVTLLSNNWNDLNSLANPYNMDTTAQRNATNSWYRVAIISGKGLSFPQPANTPQDYGTDGGAHNFLRYIENWGGTTLNYRGSIASLYISRQGTGTYKCCTVVYSPPTRGYNFDVDFLTPALLPPRTPMFRDVNITGFAQIIRP
jgi:hypothetical protein